MGEDYYSAGGVRFLFSSAQAGSTIRLNMQTITNIHEINLDIGVFLIFSPSLSELLAVKNHFSSR